MVDVPMKVTVPLLWVKVPLLVKFPATLMFADETVRPVVIRI